MANANALGETTAGAGPFRARRLAAGLTQQRLAELAGCSIGMVRVLEGGYRTSGSEVATRIARALGALDDEGSAREPTPVTTSSGGQARHGRE